MNSLRENPYSPLEIDTATAEKPLPSWRYLPGLLFIAIGGLLMLLSLLMCAVVFLASGLWFEDENGPYYKGVIHALAWLFVSVGWISAGTAFLFAKYRLGSYLAVAMLAIFMIHFAYMRLG